MKKIFLFYIVFLFPIFAFSQKLSIIDEEGIIERVYVTTDKDLYVAGDKILCSVFCFDLTATKPSEGYSLSEFSSLAYLELVSDNGVALTQKIGLIHGRGAGEIELNPTLPTGNYKLVAYTKQNRNEDGFIPIGRTISIFNVLSPEKVEGNVLFASDDLSTDLIAQSAERTNSPLQSSDIDIDCPKQVESSSRIPILIRNLGEELLDLTISIYHNDSLSSLTPYSLGDFLGEKAFEKRGKVGYDYIPDYEGENVRVKIKNFEDNKAVPEGSFVYFSFVGKDPDIYISTVDSLGSVSFATRNIYGNKDMICEFLKADTAAHFSVELENPFIRHTGYDIPKLYLDKKYESMLIERGFGMQVTRRFDNGKLADSLYVRPNSFLSSNCTNYQLDDYTRFTLMEEVFIEFISGVSVFKKGEDYSIKAITSDVFHISDYSKISSLVYIDGVPILNHKKVIDYDPLLVKEITVYQYGHIISNILFGSVIKLDTYKGTLPSFTFDNNVKILQFNGASYPRSYIGDNILVNQEYPDYRQTIYWHPIVDIPAGESFELQCVTPAYPGTFDIVVEGITETGSPIYFKSTFSAL